MEALKCKLCRGNGHFQRRRSGGPKKRDRPRKGQITASAPPAAPAPALVKAESSKGKAKAKVEQVKKPPTVAGGQRKGRRSPPLR